MGEPTQARERSQAEQDPGRVDQHEVPIGQPAPPQLAGRRVVDAVVITHQATEPAATQHHRQPDQERRQRHEQAGRDTQPTSSDRGHDTGPLKGGGAPRRDRFPKEQGPVDRQESALSTIEAGLSRKTS